MQQKQRPHRPAWPMVTVIVMIAGTMVPITQAQHVLLVAEALSLAEIVQVDGRVLLPGSEASPCEGWRLRLDPMLRARFVHTGKAGAACSARTDGPASVYWDDQLLLPDVTGQVRAFRAGKDAVYNDAVYVDVRFAFRRSSMTVSGILKWNATTGRWHVVGNTPEAKPGLSAAR